MLRAAARGFALGLAWGVLARLFMRLLTTTPEFSWAGTLAILGFSAVLWSGVVVVDQARRTGRSRWWRLAPIPGLVLFLSPGVLLVPGAVGAAVWLALRTRAVLRWPCLLAGMLVTLAPLFGDEPFEGSGGAPPTAWLGVALLVLATFLLGVGLHQWMRRWTPTEPAAQVPSHEVGDPAAFAGRDLPPRGAT
jgi:hypothetical protein